VFAARQRGCGQSESPRTEDWQEAVPPTLELREAAYVEYVKAEWSRNYRGCTARKHAAKETEAREKEAGKVAEERRKKALAHRNSADVVAQVLNYATFGFDAGLGDSGFWWKDETKGACFYRLYLPSWGTLLLLAGGMPPQEIDLDQLDPKNISFADEPTWDGQRYAGLTTIVKHEGREILGNRIQTMLMDNGSRDIERLKRGVELIYAQNCTGTKKPF